MRREGDRNLVLPALGHGRPNQQLFTDPRFLYSFLKLFYILYISYIKYIFICFYGLAARELYFIYL